MIGGQGEQFGRLGISVLAHPYGQKSAFSVLLDAQDRSMHRNPIIRKERRSPLQHYDFRHSLAREARTNLDGA